MKINYESRIEGVINAQEVIIGKAGRTSWAMQNDLRR